MLMKKVFMAAILLAIMAACNVTRTVTTTSSAYQRGDTCVTITTKTTEMYDAIKKQ